MSLWKSIDARRQELEATWDSGRVLENELAQIATLIWGRLGAPSAFTLPEACTLAAALQDRLVAVLAHDAVAGSGAAQRIEPLRAALSRCRLQATALGVPLTRIEELGAQLEAAVTGSDPKLVANRLRRREMEDRRAFAPQQRALIGRRQETGAPVFRPAEHFGGVGQDDEGRQVLVGRSQPVGDPRAHGRPARQNRSGVHLTDRSDVVQSVGPARVEHRTPQPRLLRRQAREIRGRPCGRARSLRRTVAGTRGPPGPTRLVPSSGRRARSGRGRGAGRSVSGSARGALDRAVRSSGRAPPRRGVSTGCSRRGRCRCRR